MADRHKTKPKAVRMPDGLQARVETVVRDTPETFNAFVVAAIEERLARRESGSATRATRPTRGSTTSARKDCEDTAPRATFREPESASDIMAALRRRRTGA